MPAAVNIDQVYMVMQNFLWIPAFRNRISIINQLFVTIGQTVQEQILLKKNPDPIDLDLFGSDIKITKNTLSNN